MPYDDTQLETFATQARLELLEIWKANQAPFSGALSIVDLYTVLFLDHLDLALQAKRDASRTRIIPKTTSANALYAVTKVAGLIPSDTIYDIQMFPPIPRKAFGYCDASALKLGNNLDQAIGHALFAKLHTEFPVLVFLSDGELQCGLDHQAKLAAKWELNNLTVVVDFNRLQSHYSVEQADPTLEVDSFGRLARFQHLWESYGWRFIELDGHNYGEIRGAYSQMCRGNKPLVLVARTVKGKGIPFIEDKLGYEHWISEEEWRMARTHLTNQLSRFSVPTLERVEIERPTPKPLPPLGLPQGPLETTSVRMAIPLKQWLEAFRELNPDHVYIINSDNPIPFDSATPIWEAGRNAQHLFVGINEPFAVNLARGLANEGAYPIYLSPAAHIQSCADEFLHCGIDMQSVLLIGFYPGIDLARWGASHASYRDASLFASPGITVLQPAGPHDLITILNGLYENPRVHLPAYLRMPRRGSPDVYLLAGTPDSQESFQAGFYVVDTFVVSAEPQVILVGSGVCISECLRAADTLGKIGISTRVINVVNLTTVDAALLNKAIGQAKTIISCIDADAFALATVLYSNLTPDRRSALIPLGVSNVSGSYQREDVLAEFGIDANSLVKLARQKVVDVGLERPM